MKKYSDLCELGVSAVNKKSDIITAEALRTRRGDFEMINLCELRASAVNLRENYAN